MRNTNLYQEAIIEARELKEVAEKSVKQQIMEELSPLIKKTLENQFSSLLKEQDSSFAIEEEPTAGGFMDTATPTEALPVVPTTSGNEVSDTSVAAGGEPVDATAIAPTDDEHSVNIPLPDATGQITVSIQDLFTKPGAVIQAVDSMAAQAAPEAPEVAPVTDLPAPAPEEQVAPATDMPLAEMVRGKFLKLLETFVVAEKSATSVTPTLAENIQFGLIALIEEGQELLGKGLIESRDLVLCKKRAEKIQNSLQEKLNSGSEQNSYIEESNQKTDGEHMAIKKTLKDLFEETEIAFDGLDTEKPVKDAEAKQKKVNAQDPGSKDIGEKSKNGEWDKEGATAAASDNASAKSALEEALELFKAAMNLNEEDEASVVDADGDGDVDFGGSDAGDDSDADASGDEEFDIEALLRDFEQQLQDHGISLDNLDVDVAGKQDGDEFDLSFDLDDEGHIEAAGDQEAAGDEEADALVIAEAIGAIKKAKATIAEQRKDKTELELYNHKTVCLNKLLMREAITTQQEKKAAVVALDKGTTLNEVTETYNRIVAHKLQRDKDARSGKAAAVAENGMISESVKRDNAKTLNEGADPIVERMQYLSKMK